MSKFLDKYWPTNAGLGTAISHETTTATALSELTSGAGE
jgi:hypothetical protein